MNNFVVYALVAMFITLSANAGEVCGRIVKGSSHAQMVPPQGKTQGKIEEDDQVACGSMIITNQEPVWIELADLTRFKLAPDTFFELAMKSGRKFQLYRGEAMVSAPPTIRTFEVATPNSVTVFHGGVMMVGYTPKEKQTTVSCFNRKVEFRNKFNPEASQDVATGEMSRLWIGESRIHPTSPELMDASSIKPAFSVFASTEEETVELTAVVERAVAERSKTFVSDLETWEGIAEQKEKQSDVQRSIASDSKNRKDSSIDDPEAMVALELLKRHLYGEENDWKTHDDSRRVPSSVMAKEILKDSVYDRKKAEVKKKVKKVLKEIDTFDTEQEE